MNAATASGERSEARKLTKGEATRQSILDAAEANFARSGYDAARLETIADDVGVKQAAIFYHYAGKLELFTEVARDIHVKLIALTQARLNGVDDPWEKLMLLVEAWLDFMVARPTAARIILRNCANAASSEIYPTAYSADALQSLRDVIAEGIASGRFADVDSMYLVNLLSGSILHYVCNPEQLGAERPYRPDDAIEVANFKRILRKTARAVLDVQ